MMSPEDVLLEAIAEASQHGDTSELRRESTAKLRESMKLYGIFYMADAPKHGPGNGRDD